MQTVTSQIQKPFPPPNFLRGMNWLGSPATGPSLAATLIILSSYTLLSYLFLCFYSLATCYGNVLSTDHSLKFWIMQN